MATSSFTALVSTAFGSSASVTNGWERMFIIVGRLISVPSPLVIIVSRSIIWPKNSFSILFIKLSNESSEGVDDDGDSRIDSISEFNHKSVLCVTAVVVMPLGLGGDIAAAAMGVATSTWVVQYVAASSRHSSRTD